MSDQANEPGQRSDHLRNALFDVEHALGMYATGYCTLPAEGIYDREALAPVMPVIETCHIYMIGYVPVITLVEARRNEDGLLLDLDVLQSRHTVIYPIPSVLSLHNDEDRYFLEAPDGRRYWPDTEDVQRRLSHQSGLINFDVKYIGQAYGQDGSRNALDRLLKHETLQRISLLGVPSGYRLTLLLLAIKPNNQLFTVFNPRAKNKDEDGSRIRAGLDKLFNTSEAERTSLYEASLIRYFYPEFNKEFKNSFPSTNLKVLQDCYEKDFSAVVAEICIDELPFRLRSEVVEPKHWHIAKHDLHEASDRRMFFGL